MWLSAFQICASCMKMLQYLICSLVLPEWNRTVIVITLLCLLLYNTANRTEVDQELVQEIVPNVHPALLKFTLPKENDESGSIQR